MLALAKRVKSRTCWLQPPRKTTTKHKLRHVRNRKHAQDRQPSEHYARPCLVCGGVGQNLWECNIWIRVVLAREPRVGKQLYAQMDDIWSDVLAGLHKTRVTKQHT